MIKDNEDTKKVTLNRAFCLDQAKRSFAAGNDAGGMAWVEAAYPKGANK